MEDNKQTTTDIDNLTVTNACLYENKKSIKLISILIIFFCGVAVGLLSVLVYHGFLLSTSKYVWMFSIISVILIFIFVERVVHIFRSTSDKTYFEDKKVFKK